MLSLGQSDFDLFRSLFHRLRGEKIRTTVRIFRSGCRGFRGAASSLNQSRRHLDRGDSVCTGLSNNCSMVYIVIAAKKNSPVYTGLLSDIGCFSLTRE